MFWRMLKRDLKDKKALNIVLFLFMIMASIFMSICLVMLYCIVVQTDITYESCNSSDLTIILEQSVDDPEGNRQKVEEELKRIPEITQISRREVVKLDSGRVCFDNSPESGFLDYFRYVITGLPENMNLSYNMEDRPFYVENGHVAIPQMIAELTKSNIGDKIRITTQMGNVYELEISEIFKNPVSSNSLYYFIVSEEDRKLLYSEFPLKSDLYEIKADFKDRDYIDAIMDICTDIMQLLEESHGDIKLTKCLFLSDTGIIALLVSIILGFIAVFLMTMIFITINFNLKSAIKREEREIGMMKAIGVHSFSYKILFAVKYFAFAVVGGILSIPAAIWLGRIFINRFMYDIIFPPLNICIIISILGMIICVFFIALITILSLRRMNRISVMDAIHGENRGERFKKLPGFSLYKARRTGIPVFLALSDILKKLKRYVFLIMAYVLGISIILLVVRTKDSVCSVDYLQKYLIMGRVEFAIEPSDEYLTKLCQKAGSLEGAYKLINDNFAANEIPAHVECKMYSISNMIVDGKSNVVALYSGYYTVDDLVITKGHAPKLYNEIAIPAYFAKNQGIELGDTVSIRFKKYDDNHITSSEVTEDFIVTCYLEALGSTAPQIFTSNEFNGVQVAENMEMFSRVIDCNPHEYDYYFERMQSLYSEDEIKFIHKDDVVEEYLGEYVSVFDLLIVILSIVTAAVLISLTVLYENIFIEEEASDIALLKSMGFSSLTAKLWHYLRILILVAVSILLANIFTGVVGGYVLTEIASSIMRVTEFTVVVNPVSNFILIPAAVLALVTVVTIPALAPMNQIQIWRVKNE